MRKLKYLILAGILAISGCASMSHGLSDKQAANLTPQAKIYQIKADYENVLSSVNEYANQQWCTKEIVVACADKEVVVELYNYAEKVDTALDSAEAAVKNGNSDQASAYASTARVALAQISRLLVTKEVNK